jgi:hypothetical protein
MFKMRNNKRLWTTNPTNAFLTIGEERFSLFLLTTFILIMAVLPTILLLGRKWIHYQKQKGETVESIFLMQNASIVSLVGDDRSARNCEMG